jgi:hypothetical protein
MASRSREKRNFHANHVLAIGEGTELANHVYVHIDDSHQLKSQISWQDTMQRIH